jgi:hypothetical protein
MLTHNLDMALQATLNRDQQALEDSISRIAAEIEALRATISSAVVLLSDEELKIATRVRNSAKKLGKLLERIGEVQRVQLRLVRSQGSDGYFTR